MHAHLHPAGQRGAELGEHVPRLAHGAAPVVAALVPVRRDAEEHPRIARAERAHDQVVEIRRVLDGEEVHRPQIDAERPACRRAVSQQPRLERRVDPGPGDDAGALRGRPRIHRLDRGAYIVGGEDALLDQQLANRDLHHLVVAERRVVAGFGQRLVMVVSMAMLMAVAVAVAVMVG